MTDPAAVPGLPCLAARIVFVDDYHDGPRSGLADVAGTLHHFHLYADHADAEASYLLYLLTPDEAAAETRVKAMFEAHVGTYYSWDLPAADRSMLPDPDYLAFTAAVKAAGIPPATDCDRFHHRFPAGYFLR